MADGRFLTISLLSSGRSGTIERCLASLAPFKEQLDTEIIVVDTDSDHDQGVRRILEKYADQIIPFEWQDDFSAARNTGIDAAHGKWFLYVDDDEWFIDAQPLIDFLVSGEEKKYRWIHYPVRNYFDEAHTEYQDTWVSRLFRLTGNVRFYGKIHEILRPAAGDAKLVSALAGHTGYIYRDEEERIAHVRRNLGPLQQQMEDEPREIRWVVQAMLEYHTLKDADHALACARRAYALLEGAEGYDNACLRGFAAADIARLLYVKEEYEASYDEYRRLRQERKNFGHTAAAYLEMVASRAAYELGRLADAREHCGQYLADQAQYKDEPVRSVNERLNFLTETFEDEIYETVRMMLFEIDFMEGRDEAYETGRIGALWQSDRTRPRLQRMLTSTQQQDERFWKLVRAIAEADTAGHDPLDLRILLDDHEGVRENMPAYFRTMFAQINPLTLDTELWRIGLRRGAVLDERIAEIPMGKWERQVIEFLSGRNLGSIREMAAILDDVYMGMPDEHHAFFIEQVEQIERVAADAQRQAEEQQRRQSAQQEMKQIIDALQQKVQELVSAGMIEEADQVLREIQKYTDVMG